MAILQHHITEKDETAYKHRVMYSIIFIQVFFLILIKFWPVHEQVTFSSDEPVFQDLIVIEDVQITRQASTPPAPPKPQLIHPVPVDEIVEEEIEFEESFEFAELTELVPGMGTGRTGDEDLIVGNPQLPPTVRKIVEPSVPELPEDIKGRIELIINFLVNREGVVEEASIIQIRQYDENFEEYEVLPFIGYGLIDATIEAALKWEFRAARHEGSYVKTFTSHRFNY